MVDSSFDLRFYAKCCPKEQFGAAEEKYMPENEDKMNEAFEEITKEH